MKCFNSSKKGPTKIVVAVLVIIILFLAFLLAKNYLGNQKEKPAEIQKIATVKPTGSLPFPRKVVESYMKTTLGTIPGAQVDYERARDYLTTELKKKFTDPSFVPLSYGIQDGPTAVKFVSENITGALATVRVDGEWNGEVKRSWQFELVIDQGEWKISAINRL